MSAFTQSIGDGAALRAAAERLGSASGGLVGVKDRFTSASGGATASIYQSSAALRLHEVVNGLRGVEHELDELRTGGEQVAGLLSGLATALTSLDEDLATWEREVERARRRAEEAGPDGSSPEATEAHRHARRTRAAREADAEEAKRRVEQRADEVTGEVDRAVTACNADFDRLSPAAIRRVSLTSTGAGWARQRLDAGTMTVDDALLVMGEAYGDLGPEDAEEHLAELQSSWGYQASGAVVGGGKALVGTLSELRDAVLHPVEAAEGTASFAALLLTDPAQAARTAWDAVTGDVRADWRRGEYGQAVGRGLEALVEVAIGTKGVTKAARTGRAGRFRAGEGRHSVEAEPLLPGMHGVDLSRVPTWADGPDLPLSPRADRLVGRRWQRFGDLDHEAFMRKYWDPDAGPKGSWRYPPRDGFVGKVRPNKLKKGAVIDRFGEPTGTFASPAGTPYSKRAIPPSNLGQSYVRYRVLKSLPDTVTEGRAARWFEQRGGGKQYQFDKPIEWYVENKYLAVKHD